MNRNIIYIFFLFVICSASFSCSIFHGADLSSIHFSRPEEILQFVNENTKNLKSLEGNAIISIESPEHSGRFSAHIKMVLPDLLWMKIEGALGLDFVTILKTRDEVDFYFNRDKVLFRVMKDNLTIEKLLEIFEHSDNKDIQGNRYLSSTQVMDIFRGVTFLELTEEDSVKGFNREDDNYNLTVGKDEVTRDITISLENKSVSRENTFDEKGTLIFESRYRRFRKLKGTILPNIIQFGMPHLRRRLTIIYSRRQINKNINTQEFVLPLAEEYEEYLF